MDTEKLLMNNNEKDNRLLELEVELVFEFEFVLELEVEPVNDTNNPDYILNFQNSADTSSENNQRTQDIQMQHSHRNHHTQCTQDSQIHKSDNTGKVHMDTNVSAHLNRYFQIRFVVEWREEESARVRKQRIDIEEGGRNMRGSLPGIRMSRRVGETLCFRSLRYGMVCGM